MAHPGLGSGSGLAAPSWLTMLRHPEAIVQAEAHIVPDTPRDPPRRRDPSTRRQSRSPDRNLRSPEARRPIATARVPAGWVGVRQRLDDAHLVLRKAGRQRRGDRRTRVHRVSGVVPVPFAPALDLDSPDDGLVDGATTGIAGMHPEGKELSLRRRGEARREMSRTIGHDRGFRPGCSIVGRNLKGQIVGDPGNSRCRKVGGAALTPTLIVPPVSTVFVRLTPASYARNNNGSNTQFWLESAHTRCSGTVPDRD